jgi:hypothetical protein
MRRGQGHGVGQRSGSWRWNSAATTLLKRVLGTWSKSPGGHKLGAGHLGRTGGEDVCVLVATRGDSQQDPTAPVKRYFSTKARSGGLELFLKLLTEPTGAVRSGLDLDPGRNGVFRASARQGAAIDRFVFVRILRAGGRPRSGGPDPKARKSRLIVSPASGLTAFS